MEHQSSFSPEQGFQVISEMISRTKRNLSYMSTFLLIWGWLLFFAGIAVYLLVQVAGTEQGFFVWPAVGIIGGLASAIYSRRLSKREKSTSLLDRIFEYLWLSFAFTLVVFIIATVANKVDPNPFVMVLTGLPTFVSGMILKFKPLKLGGLAFWVIGIASFFVLKEYTVLLFSTAILVGYLIPGYMLRKSESAHV